jgi:hypothetical protein
LLLLSNLALVAFFVMNKPEKREVRREHPGSYMKDALKTTWVLPSSRWPSLIKWPISTGQQMRPLFEDIGKTKESFYKMLSQPQTSDTVLNQAASQIGDKQKAIDIKIFTHFQNIRQLCTPEQQSAFDSLIQRVVHRMIFPMRRGDSRKDSAALKK